MLLRKKWDMMLSLKHSDNDNDVNINHIVSTAILVIITFLNCFPASGHLMDLKSVVNPLLIEPVVQHFL